MSHCEIIEFKDGKPVSSAEYKNSFGGAARIWDALFNAYLKDPAKEFDSWLTRNMRDPSDRTLWDLAKRDDLPPFERAVHMATFDRAMIRRENFARFAGDLRQFVKKYPAGDRVCHLSAWADRIAASDAEAIGFWMMSVSDNLWQEWDEEADESVPYDLNARTDHFEIYDRLPSAAV